MVLLVNGTIIESVKDPEAFFMSYSRFRERVEDFLSQKERKFNESDGFIYVSQNEFAVSPYEAAKRHQLSYLGSDEATTCVILVASSSKAVGIAHFDRGDSQGLRSLIDKLGASDITVDIIGGFLDQKDTSNKILLKLFKSIIQFPEYCHLRTPCVGGFNTLMKKGIPWPRVYGVAVDIQTQEIIPASFNYLGPARVLRHIRLSFSRDKKGMEDIFDPDSGAVRVNPFRYEPLNEGYVSNLLSLPHKALIEFISTSPEVEKDSFLPHFMECIHFIRSHPDSQEIFPSQKCHCFKFDAASGKWRRSD